MSLVSTIDNADASYHLRWKDDWVLHVFSCIPEQWLGDFIQPRNTCTGNGATHSVGRPPKSINNQENPFDMPTIKSKLDSFSSDNNRLCHIDKDKHDR